MTGQSPPETGPSPKVSILTKKYFKTSSYQVFLFCINESSEMHQYNCAIMVITKLRNTNNTFLLGLAQFKLPLNCHKLSSFRYKILRFRAVLIKRAANFQVRSVLWKLTLNDPSNLSQIASAFSSSHLAGKNCTFITVLQGYIMSSTP